MKNPTGIKLCISHKIATWEDPLLKLLSKQKQL